MPVFCHRALELEMDFKSYAKTGNAGAHQKASSPPLIWFDLRYNKSGECCGEHLKDTYTIVIVNNANELHKAIEHRKPFAIFFEYDFPDSDGLETLQQTKSSHPDIPVLMFSEEKSVELSLWALRSRVWNYFVAPPVLEKLISSIDTLLAHHNGTEHFDGNILAPPTIPHSSRLHRNKTSKPTTLLAIEHIKENCHRKITLQETATLCNMSKAHFSRKFKHENGYTFQEFLITQRLERAKRLLENSNASIIEIAQAVGFSDHSNFTRAFQKNYCITPTRYRTIYLSVSC